MSQGTDRAPGLFITLEGGEGAGKSTQIARLNEHLKSRGQDVVLTREPGGTAEAEMLRSVILDRNNDWDPMEQLLLFNTARHNHWRGVIEPALSRGAVVLCDRYLDSTIAYQGAAGDISPDMVLRMHETVFGNTAVPDLTLYLDVPVELAQQRRQLRDAGTVQDRFEAAALTFHEKLRQGFLDLCQRFPDRIHQIDGAQSTEQVFTDIASLVDGQVKHG